MIVPLDLANRSQKETSSSAMLLRVSGGEHDGQFLQLASSTCTIGSGEFCTLRLVSPEFRRCHCIIVRGDSRTAIRCWDGDTTLNGKEFRDEWLAAGDRLGVGPIELEVVSDPRPNDAEQQGSEHTVTQNYGTAEDLTSGRSEDPEAANAIDGQNQGEENQDAADDAALCAAFSSLNDQIAQSRQAGEFQRDRWVQQIQKLLDLVEFTTAEINRIEPDDANGEREGELLAELQQRRDQLDGQFEQLLSHQQSLFRQEETLKQEQDLLAERIAEFELQARNQNESVDQATEGPSLESIQADLAQARTREAEAEKQIDELIEKLDSADGRQAESESARIDAEEQNKLLTEEIAELQQQLDKQPTRDDVSDIHRNELSQQQIAQWHAEADELLSKKDREIEELRQNVQSLEQQACEHSRLVAELDEVKTQCASLLEEQDVWKDERKALDDQIKSSRADAASEIESMSAANDDLQSELQTCLADVAQLQQDVETERKLRVELEQEFAARDDAAFAGGLPAATDGQSEPGEFFDHHSDYSVGTQAASYDQFEAVEPASDLAQSGPTLGEASHEAHNDVADNVADDNTDEIIGYDPVEMDPTDEVLESDAGIDGDVDDQSQGSPDAELERPRFKSMIPAADDLDFPSADDHQRLPVDTNSMLERYATNDSQDSVAQKAQTEAAIVATATEPAAGTLEAYMTGLLGKIRDEAKQTPVANVNVGVSTQTPSGPATEAEEAAAAEKAIAEREEAKRRRPVIDLDAMRDVANSSARRNIERHADRKARQTAQLFWILAGVFFLITVGLTIIYRQAPDRHSVLWQALAGLVASVICVVLAKTTKPNDEDNDDEAEAELTSSARPTDQVCDVRSVEQ